MIRLAAPAGLLALVAVALPVAIHLLSRRHPTRIRVGSIILLEEFVTPRARQLRLTDLPSLVVRVLLVVLLAVLVAQPLWLSRSADGRPPMRWLLVEPAVAASEANRAALRDLADEGLEPHLLAPGLAPLDLAATIASHRPVNVWAALIEADRLVPPGSELVVATTGGIDGFSGRRPALVSRVVWRDFPDEVAWIDRAGVLGAGGPDGADGRDGADRSDSMFVSVGTSGRDGTIYVAGTVPLSTSASASLSAAPPIAVSRTADGYSVMLASDSAGAVVVPAFAVPAVVTIAHSPDRADDARYVELALAAIAAQLRIPIDAHLAAATDQLLLSEPLPGGNPPSRNGPAAGTAGPHPPILIWLSSAPLPQTGLALVEAGATVIEDAGSEDAANPMPREATLATNPGLSDAVTVIAGPGGAPGAPLWWAGGEPVMSVERSGTGYHYRFAGRFHHDGGSLVLRPEFPGVLLDLLADCLVRGTGSGAVRPDRRILPQEQRGAGGASVRPSDSLERPLHSWLWLLAAAVFGIDRVMTLRRRQ